MKNSRWLLLISGLFVVYVVLWVVLNFTTILPPEFREYYTDTYGFIALLGGLAGIVGSKKWGGTKSIFGKAVLVLSIGLIMQFLGQLSYAIYHFVFHVENPYPSIGEVFYFGSIPVYIYGIYLLAKAVGASYGLESLLNKLLLVLVPLFLFGFVYVTFLKGYEVYDANPIVIFLDFAYPIGQAIYVTFAILTFLFARKNLGGILRTPVFILLGAFVVQYLADLIYSIKTINETWVPAGQSDLAYLVAYFLMSLALIQIGQAADKLQSVKS